MALPRATTRPAAAPVGAPHHPRVVRAPEVLPRLSVLIVNYRHWNDTARLVRQLRQGRAIQEGAAEVVIVDNHSPVSRVASSLRRCPGVALRRWSHNRGFARAVNEGYRLSQGDWLLLLNPDVTVPAGFLEGVLSVAERLASSDSRAGVLGFQLLNPDGSRQASSGPFPSLISTLMGLAWPRSKRKYFCLAPRKRRRVPWASGCCLLVRRDCLRDLQGLDTDFFLYYEDVDLCRRARAHGWSVWFEPALCVTHHRPLHRRPVPAHLRFLTRHALLTYATKHWPAWQAGLLAGIIRLEATTRRWWAALWGHSLTATLFRELGELASDMARRKTNEAQRRLGRVLRTEERRRGK